MSSKEFSQTDLYDDVKFPFNSDEFECINYLAKSSGLTSSHLLTLCSWLESKETSDENKFKLIECLIPEKNGGTIPEEICIRLTYLLSKASKISVFIKIELLKWMISVYPFMETSGRFQMLYELLLGLLKDKELLPYAAHFIFLMTDKKHATLRRVKYIFRIKDEYDGDSNCLMLILRAYSIHAPEHFSEDFNDECSCQFESLGAYPSLIKNVHHTYESNFSNALITTLESNSAAMLSNALITTVESNSAAMLSEYDAFIEKSSETPSFRFTPFHHFYKQFSALEESTNISTILNSGYKRIFLTSNLKKNVQIRIHDYILSLLHEELDSPDIIERYKEIFRLQRAIPALREFTEFLLINDNCNPDIAEVMCYEPVCCFKKIQYKLQIMREKFLTTEDIEIKCQWLNSLSKMLCYWILQSGKPIPCDGMCSADCDSDSSSDSTLFHVPSTEINKLNLEIDFLCDSLIMEDCSPFVLSQILQHYQMGTIARQLNTNFTFCFPSPSVFQLSLFSLTPLMLESLCEFILRVHKIHDSMTQNLNHDEILILKASCNDMKKVFLGGSYEKASTYLAKAKAFKKVNKRCSGFKKAFILYKHPALLMITKQLVDEIDFESVLVNPENKQKLFQHLAKNGSNVLIKLISKIK